MDFKNCSKEFEIKASKVEGVAAIVSGYFAAFNNKDSDGDIIVPGAFTKTIGDRGPAGTNQIAHLLQHDSYHPLGKPAVLKEDTYGLFFETPIIDTTFGQDTVKLYKGKVYNEHSIGYRIIAKSEEADADGNITRKLEELKLWEGSTVMWGANALTPVTGIKGATKHEALELIAVRMELLQKALTDNKFNENTVNLLQVEIGVLTEAIKSVEEPAEPTTPLDAKDFLNAFEIGSSLTNLFNLS